MNLKYLNLAFEYAEKAFVHGEVPIGAVIVKNNFRIRKLTPKECWRLMGIDDECFDKAEQVNSNSQLYKQAGNGIVVNVLYYIFKELFKDNIVNCKES